jgi:hypothetical protein
MRIVLLLTLLLLAGCSTPVPIKPKFPTAPDMLLEPCTELKKLEKEVKLSDIAKTVTDNYMLYHDCSLKSKAWIEWYKVQKKIFEDVK